ncbi:hypothetical protein QVD17_18803 [Tagetes erecta]|uniref:Uncharacterized protein n=1 Tax=Tagetes erecta TaxID=13708 RepID=A0AAD8KID4_TARER|nr:hypothetical protein QVD17_18803 [Tagetes erecta]
MLGLHGAMLRLGLLCAPKKIVDYLHNGLKGPVYDVGLLEIVDWAIVVDNPTSQPVVVCGWIRSWRNGPTNFDAARGAQNNRFNNRNRFKNMHIAVLAPKIIVSTLCCKHEILKRVERGQNKEPHEGPQ